MHVCTQTEPIGMKSRSYRVGIQLLSDQDGLLNQSLHHSFGESVHCYHSSPYYLVIQVMGWNPIVNNSN